MTSEVAVYRRSSGALEHLAPRALAPAADDKTFAAVDLPTGFDEATFVWSPSGKAFAEDAKRVETILVAAVKAEAERRKMLVRSPGSGKGAEYRQKRADAMASATVTAATLNALTKPAALAQYPAAAIEAQLTGEKLAIVLGRYLDRSTAADAEVLRVSAIEQAGVAKIKAATTAATKRAAYAAIDWTWQPA